MTKAHRLKTRAGSSPQSRGARQREAMGRQQDKGLILPLNFLLTCSDSALATYELARLAEIADLRAEMHVLLDRMIDTSAQASVVRWFRHTDRQTLKQAIENEEPPLEWAKRKIREGQRSKEELEDDFLPGLPPGDAHLAAAIRYQERNIAEGKCQNCPKPLAPGSVRYCEKHLAAARTKSARERGVKGAPGSADYLYGEITESTHGRQPGTLASLAINREKATRALCAELGIPFESAAVSLNAAKEALLAHMPQSEANAMLARELFTASLVPVHETGKKALRELRADGLIQSKGKGVRGDPCLYWKIVAKPKPAISGKLKNQVLLQTLRGEEPGPDDSAQRELASQHAIENAGRHLRGPK